MTGRLSTAPLYGGGFHTFASIELAYELIGKPKEAQVLAICQVHNLAPDKVMKATRFTIEKSRSLPYHPATYMLTVIHSRRDELLDEK